MPEKLWQPCLPASLPYPLIPPCPPHWHSASPDYPDHDPALPPCPLLQPALAAMTGPRPFATAPAMPAAPHAAATPPRPVVGLGRSPLTSLTHIIHTLIHTFNTIKYCRRATSYRPAKQFTLHYIPRHLIYWCRACSYKGSRGAQHVHIHHTLLHTQ